MRIILVPAVFVVAEGFFGENGGFHIRPLFGDGLKEKKTLLLFLPGNVA